MEEVRGIKDQVLLCMRALNSVFIASRQWEPFDASVKEVGSISATTNLVMRALGGG